MLKANSERIAEFKAGRCPGCGSPLSRILVSGGECHYKPGAVSFGSHPARARGAGWEGPITLDSETGYSVKMLGGEPTTLDKGDPRICEWTSDDLYTVQLVAGWRDGKSMLSEKDYAS